MTSRLYKTSQKPINIISSSLFFYNSKKIKTLIVEGPSDKKLLSQWDLNKDSIRIHSCDVKEKDLEKEKDLVKGKDLVYEIFNKFKEKQEEYSRIGNFIFFMADIDYDLIIGKKLHDYHGFIYNAYCKSQNKFFFNDLEGYLINTPAFKKLLIQNEIDDEKIDIILNKLESCSRFIGSYRSADLILKYKEKKTNSILNGLSINSYFDPKEIIIDEKNFSGNLKNWSNYPELTEELECIANELRKSITTKWALSRGHDITEMLAEYINFHKKKRLSSSQIETMLKLACEREDFCNSPMGRQLERNEILSLICKSSHNKP